MVPTHADFFELARSSRSRWQTVRFQATWSRDWQMHPPVRAWVRRPGDQRVETLDGRLIETSHGDEPYFRNYHWPAMLDPRELAEGCDAETAEAIPGVAIDSVVLVEHHGRPALEAVLNPVAGYDPRCGCCPLLRSGFAEALESNGEFPVWAPARDGLPYPDAHRVRIDVETGICVYSEEIGGSRVGQGHDVTIEAVDEAMTDALFELAPEPKRHWFQRRHYPRRSTHSRAFLQARRRTR